MSKLKELFLDFIVIFVEVSSAILLIYKTISIVICCKFNSTFLALSLRIFFNFSLEDVIDSAYTCIIVFIRNSCAYLLFRIWMICRCRFTNWCYLSALAQSVALRPACVCVELVTCIATVFYRQFLHPGRFYKTQLIKVHDVFKIFH